MTDNNTAKSDLPLTTQSMLNLLQTTDFQTALLKCVQPLFTVSNLRLAYLEDAVARQNKQISDLMTDVSNQKLVIKRLTQQSTTNDRQTRLNNLVVTGIDGDHAAIKEKFITLAAEKLDFVLKGTDFEVTPLRKNASGPSKALLAFSNIWSRKSIFDRRLKLRGTEVFLAEDLSKESAAVFYQARQLKKKGTISNTWTKDGSVFVLLSPDLDAVQVTSAEELKALTAAPPTQQQPQSAQYRVPHSHPVMQVTAQPLQQLATHTPLVNNTPPPLMNGYGPISNTSGMQHQHHSSPVQTAAPPPVLPRVQALLAQAAGPPLTPHYTTLNGQLPATISSLLYAPATLPTPMQPTTTGFNQISTSSLPASSTETFIGFTQDEIAAANTAAENKEREVLTQLKGLDKELESSMSSTTN